MSARAWQRRREGKRFRIAVKKGFAALKADPDSTYFLREWGLVMVSPKYEAALTEALRVATALAEES